VVYLATRALVNGKGTEEFPRLTTPTGWLSPTYRVSVYVSPALSL